MKERPILFSGPMVRAILDGRKTQTRRAIKPQPHIDARGNVCVPDRKRDEVVYGQHPDGSPHWENFARWRCPYGRPGDRLWVREAWALVPRTAYARSEGVQQALRPDDRHDAAVYREGWERSKPGPWRPSIHMPRWASRITLEITDLRVERLQDISAQDAFDEGIRFTLERSQSGGGTSGWGIKGVVQGPGPEHAYSLLWERINGPGSWDANPWVWVVQFAQVAG